MTLVDDSDMEYIVTDRKLMIKLRHQLGYESRFHWTSGKLEGKSVNWGAGHSTLISDVNWFKRAREPNGDGYAFSHEMGNFLDNHTHIYSFISQQLHNSNLLGPNGKSEGAHIF